MSKVHITFEADVFVWLRLGVENISFQIAWVVKVKQKWKMEL